MKWFKNIKIGGKIIIASLLFVVIIVVLSYQQYAANQTNNQRFNTFYADRFVPTRTLNILFKNLLQIRINMLQEKIHAERDEWKKFNERLEYSERLRKENKKIWDEYMQTKLTKKEAKLAETFISEYKQLQQYAGEYVKLLRAKKIDQSFAVSDKWLEHYNTAKKAMDGLMQLQQDIAEKIKNDQAEDAEEANIILISMLVGAVVLSFLITLILTRYVSTPLRQIVEKVKLIAQGDMRVNIQADSKDEVGELAAAMNEMTQSLKSIIGDVLANAETLNTASNNVSSTAQSLSQGANEQAANVEETSSSIEEMTSTIDQNADNAKATDDMARKSSDQAEEGGKAMEKTLDAMKQISEKISIIEEISYQTNILALNAAIEAARAGDHGKGFAVVADEVRKLAQRSQTAAQEISGVSTESVQVAERAGKLISEVVPDIKKTAELVQEIAAASNEQASSVKQINKAVEQLDQVTQQNASGSEELAATSEEMTGQAGQLSDVMQFFKIDEADVGHKKARKKQQLEHAQTQHQQQNQGQAQGANSGQGRQAQQGEARQAPKQGQGQEGARGQKDGGGHTQAGHDDTDDFESF